MHGLRSLSTMLAIYRVEFNCNHLISESQMLVNDDLKCRSIKVLLLLYTAATIHAGRAKVTTPSGPSPFNAHCTSTDQHPAMPQVVPQMVQQLASGQLESHRDLFVKCNSGSRLSFCLVTYWYKRARIAP